MELGIRTIGSSLRELEVRVGDTTCSELLRNEELLELTITLLDVATSALSSVDHPLEDAVNGLHTALVEMVYE